MLNSTNLQKAIRHITYAFVALWLVFLIPEVFDMCLFSGYADGHYLDSDHRVYAGWYSLPYIITSVVAVGYLTLSGFISFLNYSDER